MDSCHFLIWCLPFSWLLITYLGLLRPKFHFLASDGGFTVLANYIGVLGAPRNVSAEKIAMTARVITNENGGGGEMTMQFMLPVKYRSEDEAPRPDDERVLLKDVGERKFGVVKFSRVATEEVVKEKVGRLKEELEKGGFKVVGSERRK